MSFAVAIIGMMDATHLQGALSELDRDPGAAGIPAGIWRFCPGPGPGRDFVFCRDFSRDFSKVKSIFEREFNA